MGAVHKAHDSKLELEGAAKALSVALDWEGQAGYRRPWASLTVSLIVFGILWLTMKHEAGFILRPSEGGMAALHRPRAAWRSRFPTVSSCGTTMVFLLSICSTGTGQLYPLVLTSPAAPSVRASRLAAA